MTIDIVNALIKSDGEAAPPRQFFAEHTLKAGKVSVSVDGIGEIALPVTSATALQLRALATQAKFGKGEKTILNKKVRDTFEIGAAKLKINIDDAAMTKLLNVMCNGLGLPANARLVPHLHNLLIYEAGQFFKPHQDSEKVQGMVASLIIVLPSPHIGGNLLIKHAKDRHSFVSENLDARDLKCVAFYADCEHEITKVSQGYRIALSYNLVLESVIDASQNGASAANPALQAALKSHFFPREKPAADSDPIKLTYFFDHSYTEHSLRWNLLKGADSKNAAAFLNAAKALKLTPHLALVNIHQTWDVEENGGYNGHGYDDDQDEDDPDLRDMIEETIHLAFWLDANDQPLPYGKCWLDETEMCWTSDAEEGDLVESEYEGYSGNAGATMDYWYRRGAIVLWKQADEMAIQFELNFADACAKLVVLTQKTGHEQQVAQTIALVGERLRKPPHETDLDSHHQSLMALAAYLQDGKQALPLLADFSCALIDVNHVAQLLLLQSRYGADWCIAMLSPPPQSGSPQRPAYSYHAPSNTVDPHALMRALRKAKIDNKLATLLLNHHVDVIIAGDNSANRTSPVDLLESLSRRLAALEKILFACCVLDENAVTKKLIDHVIAHPLCYPALSLTEPIVALQKLSSGDWQAALTRLSDLALKGIRAELAKGIRNAGDWSIDAAPRCKCRLCIPVIEFAKSSSQNSKIWPLKQSDREHIVANFRAEGLPLRFEVIKKGSPYQLVVTKDGQIFAQAKKRFVQLTDAQDQLAALKQCP